jgi:hypothetical protein
MAASSQKEHMLSPLAACGVTSPYWSVMGPQKSEVALRGRRGAGRIGARALRLKTAHEPFGLRLPGVSTPVLGPGALENSSAPGLLHFPKSAPSST